MYRESPLAWKIIDAGGGTGPTYTSDNPQGFVVTDIVFGSPGSVTVCVPTGVPGERCQLLVAQGNVPGYPGAFFWWTSGFVIVNSGQSDPPGSGPGPCCHC